MRGLDPRIHDEIPCCIALRLCSRRSLMDCRVKPGNDHAWVGILCRWYDITSASAHLLAPRPHDQFLVLAVSPQPTLWRDLFYAAAHAIMLPVLITAGRDWFAVDTRRLRCGVINQP
jgi:hypothetical protein